MGIIQKQGVKSSLYIILGFVIGAINLMILSTAFLTQTQIGITRALIDSSTTLVAFCSLGTINLIYKFYPYYRDHLDVKKNDLPFITAFISLIGFCLVTLFCFVAKDFIIRKLGKSPEFANYFFHIFPYTFILLIFLLLEAYMWAQHKSAVTNFLRETLVRIITTVLLLLFGYRIINFNTFMNGFSLLYLIPVIIVIVMLIRSGKWRLNIIKPSKVTRRLKKKMLVFGSFVLGAHFLNVLARTNDTFLIVGLNGLKDLGVFSIALYITAIMDIPQRSLGIAIPLLSQAWKDKDMDNITNIYSKSVSNLLVVGLAMFGLIWLNIHNLSYFLTHVMSKGNQNWSMIEPIVFILGIAKVIDLGTGVNGSIIATSNLWKFDFFTNVFYTILSLPLNFFLIKYFGLPGLALSNLAALILFNSVRYWFLYHKYNLQPYNYNHLKLLLTTIAIYALIYFIPRLTNIYIDTLIRVSIFSSLFLITIYKIDVAPDINKMINKRLGFLGIKSHS
jgi:O-antigen/teichoic acid export membrane protein